MTRPNVHYVHHVHNCPEHIPVRGGERRCTPDTPMTEVDAMSYHVVYHPWSECLQERALCHDLWLCPLCGECNEDGGQA